MGSLDGACSSINAHFGSTCEAHVGVSCYVRLGIICVSFGVFQNGGNWLCAILGPTT